MIVLKLICILFALSVALSCPIGIFTATPALVGVYLCLAMPAGAVGFWAISRFEWNRGSQLSRSERKLIRRQKQEG